MYTEEYERRGFPFRNFILKLILVVIFVFLLIWLLPKFLVPSIVKQINESNNNNGIVCKSSKCDTSGIDALTSQIFSDNIEKMKDAAISYYTDERLPQEVGDSDTMTLSDMIGKKIIVPLVDKNNKACDVEKSYVKITKLDDEYILKVNLKDSEKEDYILVHLGCYTYCDSYLCQKESGSVPTKGSKATEYVPIKGYIDRGTYYPPENPTPVIIKRYCVKYDGNYYGNSGVVVSYSDYLKQCTSPTPEKKYYCEKHDNKYYDKNGNIVSYEEYVKQCSTPPEPEKHYCEKYGDNYYDNEGNVVSYEEYVNKCTTPTPPPEDKHYCEKYNGKYYDKNGNVVSYEEYEKQCGVPHYCEYYNGKYYDKNGNVVSKEEYKKSCEEEIEYLYEYSKTTNTKFSEWTKWGSWEKTNCATEEINCSDSSPTCLFKLQRFDRREVVGSYKHSYTKSRDVVRQTGSYQEKTCSKYNYYRIDNVIYATTTTTNYVKEITMGSGSVGDWILVQRGAVFENQPPQETPTRKYVLVGIKDDACGVDACTSILPFVYDVYEYRGGLTQVGSEIHVIGSSQSTSEMTTTEFQASCGEYVVKTIPIYSTIRVTEIARRDEPLYGTVCYQSTKSRTIVEQGKTQTTWSTYNDSKLLNDGWTYTGNKKRK